VADTSVGW